VSPLVTPIKLFIADVDGTLVTQSKVLTPRAIDAVARLRDAGIALVITSGRPPRGMAMLVEPLHLTTPIAAFNGGLVVKPDLVTVIEQHTLPRAVAVDVTDYLLGAGVDVWIYRGAEWLIRDPGAPHVEREQRTVQFAPTVTPDVRSVLEGAIKIVGVSDDTERLAHCEAELRARVGKHASAARSQPYYLDVTHPNANKGSVVRACSERLGVPLDAVAAIGDMPNDVLMFALAGMSIAMGNASPEVQRTARYVTTSNEEEGFANAIDRFILGAGRGAQTTVDTPPGAHP
jgi:Cof subfamily protein (haloacid dehalogenase superfamily)